LKFLGEIKMGVKKNETQKKEFYKSYNEFMMDYAKFLEGEDKRAQEIIEQNRRDMAYLKWKLANEEF